MKSKSLKNGQESVLRKSVKKNDNEIYAKSP